MSPLSGDAAADSRHSEIGRSDRALSNDGSWTRAPERLAGDHREEVSHTPAELLKPGTNRPAEGQGEAETDLTLRDCG